MNVTVRIPEDIAERLRGNGDDLARRALEAFAVAEYQAGWLTDHELRQLFGFGSRVAPDAFLKARGVYLAYDGDDLDEDRRDLERLGL